MWFYVVLVTTAIICSCGQAFPSNRGLNAGSLSRILGRTTGQVVPRVSVEENARKLEGFLLKNFDRSPSSTARVSPPEIPHVTLYSQSAGGAINSNAGPRFEVGSIQPMSLDGDTGLVTKGLGQPGEGVRTDEGVHTDEDEGQIPHTGKYEVMFLLDSSGSIGSDEFLKAKQFISEIVDILPATINQDSTRVAAISFSEESQIRTEFDFTAHNDKNSTIRAINSISYQDGPSTHTARALNKAKELFDRQGRAGAEKTLFVVTDGQSNGGRDPAVPARAMKNTDGDDVTIVVVAASNSINMQEIRSIASRPPNEHIYYVSTFTEATDVTHLVNRNMQARFSRNRGRK